jgi:hypothetical protein
MTQEQIKQLIDEIAASGAAISELTGQPLLAELLQLIGKASAAYELVSGSPVDPAMVPKIERLG